MAGADLPIEFVEPDEASWDDLALVHTAEYLDKLRLGTLAPEDIATLELPWRPELLPAFRLMAGGTVPPARPRSRTGARRTWAAGCTTRSRIMARGSAR